MIGKCPNCGAWVSGSNCEYCGTIFENNDEIDQLKSTHDKLMLELKFQEMMNSLHRNIMNKFDGQFSNGRNIIPEYEKLI